MNRVIDSPSRTKELAQPQTLSLSLSVTRVSLKLSQQHFSFLFSRFCHPIYLTEGDVLDFSMIWNHKETMTNQGGTHVGWPPRRSPSSFSHCFAGLGLVGERSQRRG